MLTKQNKTLIKLLKCWQISILTRHICKHFQSLLFSRNLPEQTKADRYLQIAELFLEAENSSMAEGFVTKAERLSNHFKDEGVRIRHILC